MPKAPPETIAATPSQASEKTDADSSTAKAEGWMQYNPSSSQVINALEMTSITALVAYVVHITGQTEFSVERQFADRFNIPNLKCLPAELYDDAIRYLVDQVPQSAPPPA